MSKKLWTAAALAGATLGLMSMLSQPAMADGTRIHDQHGVLWLGALSTGYVVGTPIYGDQTYKVAYMKVPISRIVVIDSRTGQELWQGKPSVGQVFEWGKDGPVKFIVYSSPETVYPPWSTDPNAQVNLKKERPVLDAIELQMVAVRPLQNPDYWHSGEIPYEERWDPDNSSFWPPANADTKNNYLPHTDPGSGSEPGRGTEP